MVRVRGILRRPVSSAGRFVSGRIRQGQRERRAFREAKNFEAIKQARLAGVRTARRQFVSKGRAPRRPGKTGGPIFDPRGPLKLFDSGFGQPTRRPSVKRRVKRAKKKKSITIQLG